MMQKLCRIMVCSLPAILACGCPFADPCRNVTCDEGEVCVDGECVECATNDDCATGLVCSEGVCVECDSDDDCPTGETCDEATNTCTAG